MKNKQSSILFILLSVFLFSCENSDDEMDDTEISPDEINAIVTASTWSVSLFEEEGIDETSDFAGFAFAFNEGGVVRADSMDSSFSGAWSITSDDDDSKEEIDFNIFFSSPANFAELSEDWDIVSYSDTRIELKDVDEENTDRLIFEKQ